MNLLESFEKIKAFVFDMDGVLTDGTLLIMPEGEWVRKMHIRDGYALQLAVKRGYHVCIISGSASEPVKARLQKLGVQDIYMNIGNKKSCLETYMQQYHLTADQVLYMGDDMPDYEVSQLAGMPCCPADACLDIRAKAVYISPLNGGMGCVRDVLEKVMKLHGHWETDTGLRSL